MPDTWLLRISMGGNGDGSRGMTAPPRHDARGCDCRGSAQAPLIQDEARIDGRRECLDAGHLLTWRSAGIECPAGSALRLQALHG
jgi:hypothetical protein